VFSLVHLIQAYDHNPISQINHSPLSKAYLSFELAYIQTSWKP